MMDTIDIGTGLVVVDYFQAFDSERDERSVERVVARLAWGLLDVAKEKRCAVVAFSQVKKEVLERGRKFFDSWMWQQKKSGEDVKAHPQAVEGYRPLDGDAQWASAINQRAKDVISIFRPGNWLRKHGFTDAKDDTMEFMRVKGNYAPGQRPVRMQWDGGTTTISERKKK
jgi:replicative DNA helicase